jgi:DNA-binding NtrC family response regulator
MTHGSILVVDDEETLRTSLTNQLKDEDYDVLSASNSQEAIALLNSKTFDLVILDMKFPQGMTGHELLRYIKTFFSGTKVIVLTGYATIIEGKTSLREGADEFLSKPYNVEDLLQTVARHLAK